MKQRFLLFMMTALLSVGAWAVNDISLSVIKDGMSPNWAASVNDNNEVTLNRGGAVEWALFPAISTANYTGVEVVFATAPTIVEGQSLYLSVYYEGENDAVTTTYESGTTLSATFDADKKVSMAALTTGWSDLETEYATFTLASATIKGASGAATTPSANLSLPFSKITAPAGWGLTITDGTQNLVISQYSSAGWTFTTAVNTTEYTGINLTLTQAPAEGGSITIKYEGADDQTISVNASTTSVVADFEQSGTVTGIYFNGNGWKDNESLPDLTYGIGDCYLVCASSGTTEPTEPSTPDTENELVKDDASTVDTNNAHTEVYTLGTGTDAKTLTIEVEKTSDDSGSHKTNGTISASATTTGDVTTITLTPAPAEGYQLSQLIIEKTVDAGSANGRKRAPATGGFITATKQDDGTWTFTMPESSVIISAAFAEAVKPQKPTLDYNKATRTITITNTEYVENNSVTATLHYTLNDGEDQTTTAASATTEAITVNTAVKAWIVSTGTGNSDNAEATFYVAAQPTVTYNDGDNTVSLSLTAATATNTADKELYYTTDGSEPSTSSTQLSANTTIDITEGMTTIKVLALDADGNYSEIVTKSVAYAYYLTASKEWTTYYNNYSKTFSVPDGLKAYTVTNVTAPADGQSGTIEVADQQVIAPNTPMLIYNEGATTTSYKITVADDQTITGTASEFKGVDADFAIPNDGKLRYVLVDGVFLRTTGGTLPAYRCYLELGSTAAGARSFSIAVGGNTTAIETVGITTLEGEGQWYDLQGRRVMQPQKGIYIRNGKKVVVR